MARQSKKRARQARRRAERREAKKDAAPEPGPGTLLLRRIRAEACARHDARARRLADAEDEQRRQLERARARGEA